MRESRSRSSSLRLITLLLAAAIAAGTHVSDDEPENAASTIAELQSLSDEDYDSAESSDAADDDMDKEEIRGEVNEESALAAQTESGVSQTKDTNWLQASYRWTQAGIFSMQKDEVADWYGHPKKGDVVRPRQLQVASKNGYPTKRMLIEGLVERELHEKTSKVGTYSWTEAGIHALDEQQVSEWFGSPLAGDTLTKGQLKTASAHGYSPRKLLQEGLAHRVPPNSES